jgi:hypothetical protein
MTGSPHYPSLGAFYLADPRRRSSRERDLGLWWRAAAPSAATFRAAWVQSTGELYLMQHEGLPGGGRIRVLASAPSFEDLESSLPGWQTVCGEPGSVDWLLERIELLPGALVAAPAAA